MSPLIVLIITAAVGIEVGWEPLPEGGHEYLMQLEPEMVDLLKRETDEITSEVPPHINVRRYRIFVGKGKLPRVDGPTQPAAEPASPHLPPSEPTRHAEAPSEPALPDVPDFNNDPDFQTPALPDASDEQRRTAAHPEVSLPAPPGQAPEEHPDHAEAPGETKAPGHLSHSAEGAEPLSAVSFHDPPESGSGKKARRTGDSPPDAEAQSRPWLPLGVASVLLCCSLAANVYLAWIAWEARLRYRDAAARLRALPTA